MGGEAVPSNASKVKVGKRMAGNAYRREAGTRKKAERQRASSEERRGTLLPKQPRDEGRGREEMEKAGKGGEQATRDERRLPKRRKSGILRRNKRDDSQGKWNGRGSQVAACRHNRRKESSGGKPGRKTRSKGAEATDEVHG